MLSQCPRPLLEELEGLSMIFPELQINGPEISKQGTQTVFIIEVIGLSPLLRFFGSSRAATAAARAFLKHNVHRFDVNMNSADLVLRAKVPYGYPSVSASLEIQSSTLTADTVLPSATKLLLDRTPEGQPMQIYESCTAIINETVLNAFWQMQGAMWECAARHESSSPPPSLQIPRKGRPLQLDLGKKGKLTPGTVTMTEKGCQIRHGDLIEVKKSIFQAHMAVVVTIKDVAEVRETLWGLGKIAKATHNMEMYRIGTMEAPVEDYDSDGESGAGSKLHAMMNAACVKFGTYVMVSRWYGGIQLGPSRFRVINNCAREILVKHDRIESRKAKIL